MNGKIVLIVLLVGVLFIAPISAKEITIQVDSKHIEGMGTGNTPFSNDAFCNPIYVISQRNHAYQHHYVEEEYPVSCEDYYNIEVGQTVTLESPQYRTDYCKVVKIV